MPAMSQESVQGRAVCAGHRSGYCADGSRGCPVAETLCRYGMTGTGMCEGKERHDRAAAETEGRQSGLQTAYLAVNSGLWPSAEIPTTMDGQLYGENIAPTAAQISSEGD